MVGQVALSANRLATGWTVRESNPSGGEIFITRPDRPGGRPILLYDEYSVSFLGLKRPRRGLDRPPQLALRLRYSHLWTCMPCFRVNVTFLGLHGFP